MMKLRKAFSVAEKKAKQNLSFSDGFDCILFCSML